MLGQHRHTEVAGAGAPVVLIHAGICDSRMWDPQRATLTAEHRVLRLDLGGYGRSPLTPGPLCHAADVLAAMDRHEIDRATLVGASMGGAVAIDLAVAHPDRVSALVLVDSALGGHEWSAELRAAWDEEEQAIERGDLDAAVECTLRLWVDGPSRPAGGAPGDVRKAVATMQRTAYELQLPLDGQVDEVELVPDAHLRLTELTMPALVVDGEHDVPDFHVIARQLAATLPDSRAVTIAGAAHLPSLEQPEAFGGALLAFMAKLR